MFNNKVILPLAAATLLLSACGDGDTTNTCEGPLAAGFQECLFEFGGEQRYYQLVVPEGYTGLESVPLVLDLHGAGSPVIGDQSGERSVSGLEAIAQNHTLIAVYPQGVGNTWNAELPADTTAGERDDVGFLLALVEELKAKGNIDSRRVYAMGISNGGAMTNILGCVAADVFAAVAPVAMQLHIDPADCNPTHPIPVMEFHAPTDSLVDWESGPGGLSAPESFEVWAGVNACSDTPEVTYTKGNSQCEEYDVCWGGAKVGFCTIDGEGQPLGGHLTYINNDEVPLAELIWGFFSQFQR